MTLTKDSSKPGSSARRDLAGLPPTIRVPWEALSSDAGVYAMVVSASSEVLGANAGWHRLLGQSNLVGRTLPEILGKDFAAERQVVHDRILASGHAETVLGMFGGQLLRTVMRAAPLTEVGDESAILATSCVASEGMDLSGLPLATHHDLGDLQSLTEREFELFHHLGRGCSSEEAADFMHRSTRTIEWHRASLGDKLSCDNRVQIARAAIAAGVTAVSIDTLRRIHRAAKPRSA